MKKYVLRCFRCVLINAFLLNIHYFLHAQLPNPSSWESFVNSTDNQTISDTFRLQTFGQSAKDNWSFTLKENSSIIQDKNTLKIPVGSSVTFQPFPLSIYTDVKIAIHIAGLDLSADDSLLFDVHRNQMDVRLAAHTPNKDKNYLAYQYFTIGQNPNSLTIDTHQASQNSKGYYMTDSLFVFGNIPSYSLFKGSGNWTDTLCWSHLPALRHRNALINGHISIDKNTSCNQIAISSGSIKIHPHSSLSTNDIFLYGADNSILSEGELHISGSITLHKTFEETGKWYFISFPFDVYPSGIDPAFSQKDDTPNGGGNYFYVQAYNGNRRAIENQSSNNWEVIPVLSKEQPLFEKNKGYLIALDEKATGKTLSFSSRQGEIPLTFGQTGSITIPVETIPNNENRDNHGWFLCGNPLPAPLALSRIKANSSLDGYIYVYDGNKYQPYPIGSNYALPPYSTFFVKASSSTELEIMGNNAAKAATDTINTLNPIRSTFEEPHTQTPHQIEILDRNIHYSIQNKQLYLKDIPAKGESKLFNLLGQCIWQKEIYPGTNFIPVVIEPGIYILQIRTGQTELRHKILF